MEFDFHHEDEADRQYEINPDYQGYKLSLLSKKEVALVVLLVDLLYVVLGVLLRSVGFLSHGDCWISW